MLSLPKCYRNFFRFYDLYLLLTYKVSCVAIAMAYSAHLFVLFI